MVVDPANVKIYTVNGATAGSSSALPDWLTRRRAAKSGKSKRARKEEVESTIELIQGFEFPEASNRIKTTRDGTHAIATGTYKPQMRVWDLHELSLKFERHSDAENVDFVMLSDDWTKSIHLQNDRTIELHTQGGLHYKTRIPKFGRSLAYHFSSCDAYISASGNEVYRLNLEQGRYMTPLVLEGDVTGVNVVDVNPVHSLLSFGTEGDEGGVVQFWDPRSRSVVGVLSMPWNRLGLGDVTAVSSRIDGLSYAVGTSTGHTLLYDIRTSRHFAMKDQGYGLPMKNVAWIQGGSRMAGDGLVMSADPKVIKIWDRESPSSNFASITPANDINHVHHVPGSGVLLLANESIQMNTYFIPQLGPAPRWASFLENITEEMEDQSTRSVYEDFKFVERKELQTLGLDHLIGTPALKPYMHGYFLSLKLYDTARLIANPFAYEEHREKAIQEKMDKLAETRIRSRPAPSVKVNQALAMKIAKDEEKMRKKKGKAGKEDEPEEGEDGVGKSLLEDPRFKAVFENPEFAVDENSREYALLNPSTVAQRGKGKTAVEEEEEESDRNSLLSSGEESDEESRSGSESADSSDEGELNAFDPRARPGQKNARAESAYTRTKAQNRRINSNISYVPLQTGSSSNKAQKDATFGQRLTSGSTSRKISKNGKSPADVGEGGEMEMSWVPSASTSSTSTKQGAKAKRKGVETFGAGLERGGEDVRMEVDEDEVSRKGRTQRRKGMRSGSKNVFRKIDS